jgi:transcription antitermination factor NusG
VPSRIETARPALAWYALYTRHQHEKIVGRILANKGFDTLLPVYKSARHWKDRIKILSLPLFPCYVFFKGGFERRLDILRTPGICDIVSSGGQPIAIPPDEIEAIQKAVGSGLPLEPHPFLKAGERVTIKHGPLTGVHGILVRKKNLCRVVLSVEMLGKAAAVEVDTLMIERLDNLRVRQSVPPLYARAQTCRPDLAV